MLGWTLAYRTAGIQISYLVYKGGKGGPPLLRRKVTAMSIFIICQCVQGALATSDSSSYLGISSKRGRGEG